MAGAKIYIGSPGTMRVSPYVSPGWSPKGLRFSALTRGLNGTGTETLFGYKRSYDFEFPYCTAAELAWLELCWSGAVQPLYLVDPTRPNRFSTAVAASGSTVKGTRGFTSVGGVLSVVAGGAGIGPLSSVKLAGGTSVSVPNLLAVPGETLTFTVYIAAAASVTPSVTFYDSSGAAAGTGSGPAVAASATFVQSTFSATVPANAAFYTYTVSAGSGTADITLNALLCTTDGTTTWSAGGGTCKVAMTAYSGSTPLYPLTTVSVTFEEL